MENKQTAVEWLFLMLNNPNSNQDFANKLLEQAKQMERKQIEEAADEYFKLSHSRLINSQQKEYERELFIAGVKWQQEVIELSLQEVKELIGEKSWKGYIDGTEWEVEIVDGKFKLI